MATKVEMLKQCLENTTEDALRAIEMRNKRIAELEGSLQEMCDVMAPTIRSQSRLTQAQGSARIRALALLRQQ